MKLNTADGRIAQLNAELNKTKRVVVCVCDLATRGQLLRCTWFTRFACFRTLGRSEAKKCGTSPSLEELKETLERPETPQPPRPPVVVDHQRLMVTKKDDVSKRKMYFHWFLVVALELFKLFSHCQSNVCTQPVN